MDETGWLRHIVENMQSEIHEIKTDVKEIKEFKFKIMGGVILLSTVITFLLNVVMIMVKHGS